MPVFICQQYAQIKDPSKPRKLESCTDLSLRLFQSVVLIAVKDGRKIFRLNPLKFMFIAWVCLKMNYLSSIASSHGLIWNRLRWGFVDVCGSCGAEWLHSFNK